MKDSEIIDELKEMIIKCGDDGTGRYVSSILNVIVGAMMVGPHCLFGLAGFVSQFASQMLGQSEDESDEQVM